MANKSLYEQDTEVRLYRNSIDDIIDEIQAERDGYQRIQQARNDAIINSEDPVKKLKEIQSIEKSVEQEAPEVQETVLNQTYQPVQQPFQSQSRFSIGQPRGDIQELNNDELEFYVEMEKIQKDFDETYQKKLETAKEVPGRNVIDPMSGGSYPIPGKTKEEVARDQTINDLRKRGILNPSLARDVGNFLTTAIPIGGLTPREQAEQTFTPVRDALAQVGGTLTGFVGFNAFLNAPKLVKTGETIRKGGKILEETFRRDPGKLTQIGVDLGRKISSTKLGNILKNKGVTGSKIQRFTTGATTGAGTFGAYSLVNQIDEDSPIDEKALIITENAIFGAGFGLTGNIANRGARALADGTYGFVTSKLMEGATTEEALLNGLLFAGFGLLNNKNVTEIDRQFAVKDFVKQADDIFSLIQTMRVNAGKKAFTKIQQKQYTKVVEDFANELYGKGVSAKDIEKQTEEFLSRFIMSNDPKGSISKIRQIANQRKTSMLQQKSQQKKEAVEVPITGKDVKVSKDDLVKAPMGEQLDKMKALGYTEKQFVNFTTKEREDILANSIKAVNNPNIQPTQQSMPVDRPAPDKTPSTKKLDKSVPEKLEPKKEEVKSIKIPPVDQKIYKEGLESGEGEVYYQVNEKGDIIAKAEVFRPDVTASGKHQIDNIFVTKEYQRQGLATGILNKIAQDFELNSDNISFGMTVSDEGTALIKSFKNKLKSKKEIAVQPKKEEATGLVSVSLKPKNINIDESKFQPREEYNQSVIDDIAKNFDKKKWDEPILWQDPKTNKYFVVSGHHRHQGVVKGGYESATYKVLPKGTTIEEAINMSEEGNLARTEQSAFENSSIVRRRFDRGDSLVQIAKDLPGLTKAKSSAGQQTAISKVLNLSYLDAKGKFRENYESINEFPRIQSTSQYVGALRKKYDWMPDQYEDDIFTYLYTEAGIKQDNEDWKLSLDNTLEKLMRYRQHTRDERPGSILKALRRDPLKPKDGTPDEVLQEINDIKKSIENIDKQLNDKRYLQREIDRLQQEKDINDVDALTSIKSDLRKQKNNLRKELNTLIEESSKPDPNQGGLFEEVEQYNMFGGRDILPDISKKDKEILNDLYEQLRLSNKEFKYLMDQSAQGTVNAITVKKQKKLIEQKYKDIVKQIQKIDPPVKGATISLPYLLDINDQLYLNLKNRSQLDLFRENATKQDKEKAKEAKSTVSRLRQQLGITERASSILKPMEKVGASHFIGKQITSPQDLATISQVARDRRFETLRIFYTKKQPGGKDKIVQYTSISNRMPGFVSPWNVPELGISGYSDFTSYMAEIMMKSKADGYFLMHNHPSGKVIASKGDVRFTKWVKKRLPGFKGHIILNHNKYGLIEKNGTIKMLDLLTNKPITATDEGLSMQKVSDIIDDPLHKKEFSDLFSDKMHGDDFRKIVTYKSIPKILKAFEGIDDVVSIFATDYSLHMKGLVDIPLSQFIKVGQTHRFGFGMARLKAQIRKIARDYGGQRIFLAVDKSRLHSLETNHFELERVFKRLIKDSFITDAYLYNDYDKKKNYIYGVAQHGLKRKHMPGRLEFKPRKLFALGRIEEADYRGVHKAPTYEVGYANSGDDVSSVYPDDIYGANGARYYGTFLSYDNKAISIMRKMRGNPEAEVIIYRAVPNVKDVEINPGDWVSITKEYATEHGKRHLDGYKILQKKVKAKEIFTEGNALHEWGYDPERKIMDLSDDIPMFDLPPSKKSKKEAPKVPQKIYDNVKIKSPLDIAKERKSIRKTPGLISKALTPLSTRLRLINPELKRAIRRFQYSVDINTAKDLAIAENFIKMTDKLRKKNKKHYAVLDLALKNSDFSVTQEVLKRHGMKHEFVKLRNMLDSIYKRSESVGYEPNYLSDYFPRKIKDADGLMSYLETTDSWGIIQSNIKAKEKELGRRLEKEERLKLINNLIRGFGGRLGIQRPGNLKEREIEYLDSDLNEFYYDSNTALHKYIVQMNEAIEIKRFFGKDMGSKDINVQVDDNVVGEYVDKLLEQGIIKSHQQDELVNLFRIRFAQGIMDPRVANLRSSSYLFTMGQLSSAITQIGDFAWSIYNAGMLETLKATGRSAIQKSEVTRKDIGIEKIAQEFTETDSFSKILDNVFTATGLKYIDSLGKESLINATIAKYRKQAVKGKFSSQLQDRLNDAFAKEEIPQVIQDLKDGKITDNILYLSHYTISDFQPVSLTEMPEYYLKAPNGRIMYMLKTYTVKQLNVLRDEAFRKMYEGKTKKEKAEGVRRLIYLAGVLMMTGITSDSLKNFLYKREQDFSEMVGDNLLRLVGFQKYLIWHYRRYKNVGYTVLKAVIPPVGVFNPVFEAFVRDLDRSVNKKDFKIPKDLESPKNIPIVGRLYYNYFGNGAKFHAKRKEKEKKKNKSSKKVRLKTF